MKKRKPIIKSLIVSFILLIAVCSSPAQKADTIKIHTSNFRSFIKSKEDSIKIDTTAIKICQERGHVLGGQVVRTLMSCGDNSYIIDTDSSTIMVVEPCNFESFTCVRCRNRVSQLEKEQRIVIWRREE